MMCVSRRTLKFAAPTEGAGELRLFRIMAAVVLLALGESATAQTFLLPSEGDSLVGEVRQVKARHEDTFSDIARRYNIGFNSLVQANPAIDPWLPGEGAEIVLPTLYVLPNAPRDGLVLNVAEMRLYFYPKPRPGEAAVVITYPVSIGRQEWNTPLGKTQIVKKTPNPVWVPPRAVREEHKRDGDTLPAIVPAGPDNPLGAYALRLGIPGYLIHGTNRPYGVGMRVTHGCVRLYPEDIRSLFNKVDVGTPVYIVNQPYKAGWSRGALYFEAHPALEEDVATKSNNRTPAVKAIVAANPENTTTVDWPKVIDLAEHSSGIPQAVTLAVGEVSAVVSQSRPLVMPQLPAKTAAAP